MTSAEQRPGLASGSERPAEAAERAKKRKIFQDKLLAAQRFNHQGASFVRNLIRDFTLLHPEYADETHMHANAPQPEINYYFIPSRDESLQSLLDYYREKKKEEFKELKPKVTQARKDGERRIHAAIDSGRFPQLSREFVSDRFAKTKIVLVDELSAWVRNVKRYEGRMQAIEIPTQYSWLTSDGTNQTLYISDQIPERFIPYVLQHDLFHVVSGQTYPGDPNGVFPTRDDAQQEGFVFPDNLHKSGLNFTRNVNSSVLKRAFCSWLDEAVIHDLTMDIFPDSGVRDEFYFGDHKLYNMLKTRGNIEKRMFEDALFENYGIAGIPLWQKLYTTICERFAPGFLEELDMRVSLAYDGGKSQLANNLLQTENPAHYLMVYAQSPDDISGDF